jgi:TPR repeat protein
MLMEGKGVDIPQYVEAALHLQAASDGHVPQAHHLLAMLYEYGKGINQDFRKAIQLYKQAAEETQVESMYHLGLIYSYGRRGVAKDFLQARSWFENAAVYDHAPSIYYIGMFKVRGYGCEVNYEQALRWFYRAISIGDERIYKQAMDSANELKMLIEKAQQSNEDIINSYHRKNDF